MSWAFLLAIGVISRAFSALVQKTMLKGEDADPIAFAIVYQLMTGCILALYLVFTGIHLYNYQSIIPNLIITTVLSGLGNVFMFQSLKFIESSEFTILYSSRVLWTIIGTIVFLKASFSLQQSIGAICIIGSVFLVTGKFKKSHFNTGKIFALIAAMCFGCALANDAIAVQHIDVIMYSVLAFISPGLLTWFLFPKSTSQIKRMFKDKRMISLAVFCFLLSVTTVTVYEAYKIGNPAQITTLYQTSTVLAVLLAILVLKETANLGKKIGGALIAFLGVLLIK